MSVCVASVVGLGFEVDDIVTVIQVLDVEICRPGANVQLFLDNVELVDCREVPDVVAVLFRF